MADLPVPGEELTADAGSVPDELAGAIPATIHDLLAVLLDRGHAAYVVGGSLRDTMAGRTVEDWDLATAALPEQTLAAFDDAVYENAFGTVALRTSDVAVGTVEITTFRSDHDYADFRRPHRVEFGTSIELDLARRDFTVNAMAWGAEPGARAHLVDPHDGRTDLTRRILRAVGDPERRFGEDALRMIRGVRLAAALEFEIEPATLAAIAARAGLVRHLSGERIGAELRRLLAAARPSIGLRLLHDTGLLANLAPELAAQRGLPQNKIEGEDLWDHTLRAVDAAPASPGHLRLAALLHDVGKPATMADGRFVGHETVGAEMAAALLDRWRWPLEERDRVLRLIRQHMFGYLPSWSDAAVRRFIVKVGRGDLDDLFLLREADNVGSGRSREHGDLPELRRRIRDQLDAGVALSRGDLALDGTDLMREFDLAPGPVIGRLLDRLLDRVIGDPALNTRDRLLTVARAVLAHETIT